MRNKKLKSQNNLQTGKVCPSENAVCMQSVNTPQGQKSQNGLSIEVQSSPLKTRACVCVCVCVCVWERERERQKDSVLPTSNSVQTNFLYSPYLDSFSTCTTSNCGSIQIFILLKWNEVLHIDRTAWRRILSRYFANCKRLYSVERQEDDCEGRVPASAQTAWRKSHYSNNICGIYNLACDMLPGCTPYLIRHITVTRRVAESGWGVGGWGSVAAAPARQSWRGAKINILNKKNMRYVNMSSKIKVISIND